MTYTIINMEIAETSIFTRQIRELISGDEYGELQFALIQRPDMGDLIPQSGGIRKVRWSGSGRGDVQDLLMLPYPKNRQDDLTTPRALPYLYCESLRKIPKLRLRRSMVKQ